MYQHHAKRQTYPFPLKLPEKNPKNQVARYNPGCRSIEESRDAKRVYSFEAYPAEMDRHVTRMPDVWLPKKVFDGELQVGKRSQGGQKKRYKDTIKVPLKNFNIPPESLERIA